MGNQRHYSLQKQFKPIFTAGRIQLIDNFLFCRANETVVKYSLERGEVEKTFEFPASPVVFSVGIHKRCICVVTDDLLLQVLDLETEKIRKSWKPFDSPLKVIEYNRESTLIATGAADGIIKIWDAEGFYCTHLLKGHSGPLTQLLFNHTGKWELYSASEDGTIRVWDLQEKKCRSVLKSHVSAVTSLVISNDGNLLFSAGRDKIINVWDLSSCSLVKTIPVYRRIETIAISEDAKYLYVGGETAVIDKWDWKNMKNVKSVVLSKGKEHEIDSILLDKDSLIATTNQSIIYFLDTNSLGTNKIIIGFNDEITDIAPISNDVFAMSTNNEIIKVYDSSAGTYMLLTGHSDIVLCLASDIEEKILVSGSKDSSIHVWTYTSAASDDSIQISQSLICQGHTEAINCLALHAKSNEPFFASVSGDKTLKKWQLKKATTAEGIQCSAKMTIKAHEKDINSVAISENGKFIATGSQDKTIKLWSSADLSSIATLKGHKKGVWSVKFNSSDMLASSSSDQTVRLWSLTDFTCLKTFEGHTNSVLRVLFSPDTSQLISAGSDGLVKVWDIKKNDCILTLDEHMDRVWTIALAPDGKLLSGGADSVVNIWIDDSQEQMNIDHEKMQEIILLEQDLANLTIKKEYYRALICAMKLEKPSKLLSIFTSMMSMPGDLKESVNKFINGLTSEELKKMLEYARDWNCTFKDSLVANTVLESIFTLKAVDSLAADEYHEYFHGMIAYNEKHLKRVNGFIQNSYLIDYTLARMVTK